MSREQDDAYYENFSVFDETSRPAPRVQEPAPPVPRNYSPAAAVTPAKTEDDYFTKLSVFEQGQAYEPPTMRIPQNIIKQLGAGIIPGQQQAEPVPTKVEHNRDGFVTRISGSLIEPPGGNAPAPQGRGGNSGRSR